LEDLINQQQKLLQSKQGERVSLERDLQIIDAEIEKSRLAIKAQKVAIRNLEEDIFSKEALIAELEEKISREKESLAALVRNTAELDDLSLVEIVFSGKTFSEFFEELDTFEEVKIALRKSFIELEDLRDKNIEAKKVLNNKKAEEEELHELQKLQRARLEKQELEKKNVIKVTKGEEERYQRMITTNRRTAAQIRSELFELRGSAAINLGDAIEFATFAGNKTGVRPALILGVLKQETRLGEFLGNGVWTKDMHPTRDRPLFKVITSTLGLDPNRMPVSAKPGYGWGGAMGPAQFIPSTWACYGGYINVKTKDCNNRARKYDWDTFWAGPWKYDAGADRLRVVRGKQSPSNPWDNQDAFIAAAILMKDNGADAGTLYAERLAALRYFAGWSNATNPAYAFYGDGVMEHAKYFQKQIDTLKELSE
jgi:peptidoglycan hydrolase CwlO-like protein